MFHVKQLAVLRMASYTMELREYIEQVTQYEVGLTQQQKIEHGRVKLFDFEYPFFDLGYKNVFETHFIRNFYMREIGFETEGLFKFQLESWLLINMPFFNKMFESELIEFDPLHNSKVDTTYTRITDKNKDDIRDITQNTTTNEIGSEIQHQDSVTDGISHSDSVQDSTSDEIGNKITAHTQTDDNFKRDLKSNTPDTRLNITTNDGEGVITYASTIDEENQNNVRTNRTDDDVTKGIVSNDVATNDGTSKTTSVSDATNDTVNDVIGNSTQNDTLNSVINETEDYIQHRVGKMGTQSYSKMLMEYRDALVRIERQMFDEMQELFMLVY